MITTKGQIQGDYCEKYNLGIAIENTDDLANKIQYWIDHEDFTKYQERCIELLRLFLSDYDKFKNMVKSFIEESVI